MLLFTDGHKSHINLDVIDLYRQNHTILCLPPHTTTALQPLDVSVFKSLKDLYAETVHSVTFAKAFFYCNKEGVFEGDPCSFQRTFQSSTSRLDFLNVGLIDI